MLGDGEGATWKPIKIWSIRWSDPVEGRRARTAAEWRRGGTCFVGEQSEVVGVAVVVDKRAWLAKAKILNSDLGEAT